MSFDNYMIANPSMAFALSKYTSQQSPLLIPISMSGPVFKSEPIPIPLPKLKPKSKPKSVPNDYTQYENYEINESKTRRYSSTLKINSSPNIQTTKNTRQKESKNTINDNQKYINDTCDELIDFLVVSHKLNKCSTEKDPNSRPTICPLQNVQVTNSNILKTLSAIHIFSRKIVDNVFDNHIKHNKTNPFFLITNRGVMHYRLTNQIDIYYDMMVEKIESRLTCDEINQINHRAYKIHMLCLFKLVRDMCENFYTSIADKVLFDPNYRNKIMSIKNGAIADIYEKLELVDSTYIEYYNSIHFLNKKCSAEYIIIPSNES